MNAGTDALPKKHQGGRGGVRKLAGVLLAGTGFFWLARKTGWMPADHGHPAIFWPVVVIAFGLFLFFGAKHNRAV